MRQGHGLPCVRAADRAGPQLVFYPLRRGFVLFLWWLGRVYALPVARTRLTSWRVAGRQIFELVAGFGRVGEVVVHALET